MPDQWDDETQQSVNTVAELLKMKPDRVCNFIVVAIDHEDNHTPVSLSTIPMPELGPYLMALGLRIAHSDNVLDFLS